MEIGADEIIREIVARDIEIMLEKKRQLYISKQEVIILEKKYIMLRNQNL